MEHPNPTRHPKNCTRHPMWWAYTQHYRCANTNGNKIICPPLIQMNSQEEDQYVISSVGCSGYAESAEKKNGPEIGAGQCAKSERAPIERFQRTQVMVA
jgi:hypothetical protein